MTKRISTFRDTHVCNCGLHGFTGLTRGHVAFCDPESVPLLAGQHWCLDGSWPRRYAARNPQNGERFAHRLICSPQSEQIVDHINGDSLDNRRDNLRICEIAQNVRNRKPHRNRGARTSFKGVYPSGASSFRSKICFNRRMIHLGTYASPVEAAHAYDEAALLLHGEFARTNAMLGLLDGCNHAKPADDGGRQ